MHPRARPLILLAAALCVFTSSSCGPDVEQSDPVVLIEDEADASASGDPDAGVVEDAGAQDGGDAGQVEPCEADAFVLAGVCSRCPAGTTNEAGDDPSGADTSCDVTRCGVDERVVANACVACAPGTGNMGGDDASGADTDCDGERCPSDRFVRGNACVACPPGTRNDAGDDASGPDTACEAVLCDADERVVANACVACPPGTTNDPDDDASGADTSCEATLCARDERVADHACVVCPQGATNDPGDDASGEDTTCEPTLCAQDEYVLGNTCEACGPGTTNDAGDDASGPDTSCDVTSCAANQYVSNNACVSCPAFTTNDPGDDASGPDTACEAVLCGADERVVANACVACPPGTTNGPDDAVAGPDTSCDAVLCAADEYVSNNACVPCPANMTNGAGDDASGADTSCEVPDPCMPIFGATCSALQSGYLKASNTDEDDDFGRSVALDTDTLVVGAVDEDSDATGVGGDQSNDSAPDSGAVYVFVRSGGVWTQQAYLKASNTGAGDSFGRSVALSGDTLVVGATSEDSDATGIGGDQANDDGSGSGAVYVFVRSGTTWTQQAYIKASNASAGDSFGRSVALSADTLAVGANGEDSDATGVGGDQSNDSAPDSGAVYVFVRSGGVWTQQAYLKASNTDAGDFFGTQVSLAGDTLAVGAPGEASNARVVDGDQTNDSSSRNGAAYVFVRNGAAWTQQAYLKASRSSSGYEFGASLASSGDTIVVGSPKEGGNARGVDGQSTGGAYHSGAAYVFVRSGTTWTQQAYIKASNTDQTDNFGASVALSGDTLVVGAPLEDSASTGINGGQTNRSATRSGAVYVFSRTGTTWAQALYIKSSNSEAYDLFGQSVASSGDTIAAGATGEDGAATGVGGDPNDNTAPSSGAVHVFEP